MAQNKAGLHKKISSIFDGVPVPNAADQQKSSAPAADSRGHLPPRPSTSMPQVRQPVQVPPRIQQDYPSMESQSDVFVKTSGKSVPEYLAEKLGALKLGNFADKQKIKILIVPILVIILILVLYRQFAGSARSVSPALEPQGIKMGTSIPEASAAIIWQRPDVYPAYMRDPTQLAGSNLYSTGAGSLAVRGIVYSDDKPSVVIGSEIKHEGDIIGEVTIVRINHDSVEFSTNGKKWTQRVQ